MDYTIIVDGRSYDLPKKTIGVMEKLDEALKIDSNKGLTVKQKYEKLHSFVKGVVGDEAAQEMFGSDNISEIDLSELGLTVLKIRDAYDEPFAKYDEEKMQRKFDSIPTEKLLSFAKSAQAVANAQGLKK